MGLHEKTFDVPWRPTSKARMHFASSFLVLAVLYFISSLSGASAQYYCLYNFQNTGSNFALVRHAPDSTGTWYTTTFGLEFWKLEKVWLQILFFKGSRKFKSIHLDELNDLCDCSISDFYTFIPSLISFFNIVL